MKRRDALKNIGLSAGLIIVTPSVISLLNSCNTNTNNYNIIDSNNNNINSSIMIINNL